ncbi:MAG: RdgB/HAM1 family non-canonical purine NTP pyrophosphatase [Clostridium sp.]|nr:RdgB/HAM1 family non-canonical purine NTP pyrophosphatase [Prevotella sp.]MCM1429071.1 RdgB/HAM1 family non-canonical purine NTP pyrophosphatase [Clostridium sp.]MCM1475398.1 RdgB/HAM1 family non-canonical purine NTP pyrophosphatase [Muribaculaceae bacterium]
MERLVFATNNVHKLEEARRILDGVVEILSLSDIGCHEEIPENADTIEGNSRQKAEWILERYGLPTFADDTGLMVDALDGAPGVYTARYAGLHCSPDDNIDKMLHELEGVLPEKRTARFMTVVAYARPGHTDVFEGIVEGTIAQSRHGSGGFGYDPIFCANESGKCFAEMSGDDKDAISHRGRAMRAFADFLKSNT